MEVIVRVDAAPDIGLGHFMRCFSLVQAMRANIDGVTMEISFLSCAMPESMVRLLDKAKISFVKMNLSQSEIGSQKDLEQTIEKTRESQSPFIVLDSYKLDYNFQKTLSAENCRIFAFDDDCRQKEYYADLVLNQTFQASEQAYFAKRKNENGRFLLGHQFILLREEFLDYVGKKKRVQKEVKNILMSVGGSDLAMVLQKSYDALLTLATPLNLCIVTGSTNLKKVERNLKLEKEHKISVEIKESVNQISSLMNWADIAICGGGATAWELAFMGVPFMAVSYNDAERANIEALTKFQLCTNLGQDSELSSNDILEQFLRWSCDYESRKSVAEKGPALIDGKGYTRILSEVRGLIGV